MTNSLPIPNSFSPWQFAIACGVCGGICGGTLGGGMPGQTSTVVAIGLHPLEPVLEEFEPNNDGKPDHTSGAGGRCWEFPQELSV